MAKVLITRKTREEKNMSIAMISGLIILVLLVIMLVAGVPIAIALGISSVCAILPVMDLNVAVLTGAQRIFSGISVFSLLAIPFYILAGNIMNKGGIAVRLINLAKLITGRTPGALAHTNVIANMLFGSISGSGTAAASAMGSIIGPIEKDEGYDPSFSAAVNVATAPTGLLIPPSNVMITFSLVSGGTSVAALFMAGYIPGILWGLACMAVIYFIAKKHGYRAKTKFAAKEAGSIIFLIGVSSIMSWVMAFTNIPTLVSSALLSISNSKYVIFFLINIILLVVGTFMDMTPACLIFTPIFLPICSALGMNTIHFGIMMIFNLCIGTITPPVGTTLFVGVKVGGVRLEDVIKQLLPFFAVIIAVLLLVTYVPILSLWLPSLMGYV